MTYANYPRKRRIWPSVAVAVAILFCIVGAVAVITGIADTQTDTTAIIATETPKAAPTAAKPAGPRKTIAGNDLVHVGEDIAPGTYRTIESVGGRCYWKKSTDAEGQDIIDNGIPAGGRPQVTLKKGQWFTSSRCPEWVAK